MKSRILVVDDDLSILELLRTLLESEGYHVQTFDSGAVALRNALRHPPDAAIVDLMMPGMNGLDLIQALRYDRRTHQLPVLICSAYYGDLRHITDDLQHNNTSCLRKPFQIQELLDLLAQMVANRRRSSRRRDNTESQPEAPTPIASAPANWAHLIASSPARRSHRRGAARAQEAVASSGSSSLAAVRPRARAERPEIMDGLNHPGGGRA